jgi:hypothetical protein
MSVERFVIWPLQSCGADSPRHPDGAVDDLELLLTYYLEFNPSPELFGELLARAEADPPPSDEP